jgi:hypothetical protein
MARVRLLLGLLILLLAWPLSAQQFVRLQSTATQDTISFNGDSVELTTANVGGFGSVKVQTLDSYSGTWEVQCSLKANPITYDTAAELTLKPTDSTTTATSVTDSVGIWEVTNASGCNAIRVIATAGFAASDTVVIITATQSGGGSSGSSGGGGAGTSDTLEATQIEVRDNLAQIEGFVDGLEALIGTTNTNTAATLTSTNFAAAFGTAGTADTQVVSVQGIASMTPVQIQSNSADVMTETTGGTIVARLDTLLTSLATEAHLDDPFKSDGPQEYCRASAATPSAVSENDAQAVWCDLVGRLHIATEGIEDAGETAGAPLSMAGTVRRDTAASSAGATGDNATLNTDSLGRLWVTGSAVEDVAETAGGVLNMIGAVQRDAAASSAGTTGDNATVNVDALGLLWTRFLDPCSGVAKQYLPIDIVTATTTEITPSLAGASNHYYVCSVNLGPTAGAQNVALVDDDSDNCGSVTSGVAGGTTAGEGWNAGANGGIALGNGLGSIARTNGTNRVLCLVTSAAVQVSGVITVVAAP